jgi:nucleoside phosphorylase/phosphoserine phosphatase
MKKKNKHHFNQNEWDIARNVKYKRVSYEDFKTYNIKIHIAIVTANDIEKKAVEYRLKNVIGHTHKYSVVHNKQTYYIAKFGIFNAVIIKLGSMGIHVPNAAAFSVEDLIKNWAPCAIIGVGVAMGMKPDRQQFGDVVISKDILNYDIKKITDTQEIIRSPRPMADNSLYDRFTNCPEWSFLVGKGKKAKTHPGLIITGASLVNNSRLTAKLKRLFPDAVGNEMEASGIWAASERNKVPWIIVKGISDWGKDKTDNYQPLAATSAVSLCETVFSEEDALSGILKKSKMRPTIRKINSLKLYYIRRYNEYSEKDLEKKTKIKEVDIMKYESFNFGKGIFDSSCFPDCPLSDIKKLEHALALTKEDGLEVKDNKMNFMGYLISFYYKSRLNRLYNDIKAVIFDFDGTLTKSQTALTTWQKIWVELGYSIDDCDKLHRKFDEKMITHKEWCDITCKQFQKGNLTKNILSEISSRISLVEGCAPTLRKLKDNNIALFIVSGSIREVIMEVLGKNIAQMFDRIQANRMDFHERTGELKRIVGTRYDFKGKCNFILEIAKELNIHPHEILFVGNSNNDELAYKSGAITLCVNPKFTNAHNIERWNNLIDNMKNLSDIIPYVITEKK